MSFLRAILRRLFRRAEDAVGLAFPAEWNPFYNLGALGFFYFWIVAVSGIYVYIFFDTGITQAYGSVEYMTHEQWYLGGVMRSLHRYASDALVIVMVLHLLREFANDRYRGVRWFSWVTGVPVFGLAIVAGITGYWMVWDKLAQYVAVTTSEWLDLLPVFDGAVVRNFLSPDSIDDRFFTLMVFIHIAVPLIMLGLLWVHLQRVTKPRINPPRGLAIGTFAMLLVLSLIHPAVSQGGPADLGTVPAVVGLDWFYLGFYPLIERTPGVVSWTTLGVVTLITIALPWLPPMRRPKPAVVDLGNCNGCTRCAVDCPYSAITMASRSDGRPFAGEAKVSTNLCVACGICAGSCPTSMPFRRASPLVPGIDLPDQTMAQLRDRLEDAASRMRGDARILVFGCAHGVGLDGIDDDETATVELACIGQLAPSYIDFVLSRDIADGVLLTGCAEGACYQRFGIAWTEARMAGERDPYLRARVPRERLTWVWAGETGRARLDEAVRKFRAQLGALAGAAPQVEMPEVGTSVEHV